MARNTKERNALPTLLRFLKSPVKSPVPYLAECGHVTEGPVLDDLVVLAGVAELRVALHGLGRQANACGLTAGGVRGIQVVVALKDHQLPLRLGDVRGEGLQDVAERHLHLGFQLRTGCQTGQQLHFIKLTTVGTDITHFN